MPIKLDGQGLVDVVLIVMRDSLVYHMCNNKQHTLCIYQTILHSLERCCVYIVFR